MSRDPGANQLVDFKKEQDKKSLITKSKNLSPHLDEISENAMKIGSVIETNETEGKYIERTHIPKFIKIYISIFIGSENTGDVEDTRSIISFVRLLSLYSL